VAKTFLRELAWSADKPTPRLHRRSSRDDPPPKFGIAALDAAAPVKHAELKGYAQSPHFAARGSTLAVYFIEGLPERAGPLSLLTPLAGVIDQQISNSVIATIDLSYRPFHTKSRRSDVYVMSYDWTPGRQSLGRKSRPSVVDANWWIARLYLVNAKTGVMRRFLAAPRWLAPRGFPRRQSGTAHEAFNESHILAASGEGHED